MRRSGNVDPAENLYRQALALTPAAGAEFAAMFVLFVGGSPGARSLVGLAALARRRGHRAGAQRLQLDGLRRAERNGDSAAIALGLEGLSASSSDAHEPERAAVLFAAAESIRTAAAVPRDRFEAEEAARVRVAAGSAIAADVLERSVAEGRRMRRVEALKAAHRVDP
jgi:hypothetical protein